MQTIQQQRAAKALNAVQDSLKLMGDEKAKKAFRTRVSELPFMIHANGLGQAVAFFRSKIGENDKHGYGNVYTILEGWLIGKGQVFHGKKDLLAGITEGSMKDYMAAQAEAMLYMDWVKKFARAFVTEV